MEKDNKNIIISTIIAVLTLAILTIGAAYAYFTVSATNSFGIKTITATTPSLGSVALTTGTNLTMNLTATQMMPGSEDITYYASSNGTTTTPTTENIGVATVTGDGTFNCNYTLTIDDNENSWYDVFFDNSRREGEIVLTINGVDYDFYNSNTLFPLTIEGTMNGISSKLPGYITAKLSFTNRYDTPQNRFEGKELTLTFNISQFECTAVEPDGANYILATASSEDIWESTLEEDGIRFVGINPDNYVCFGYSDASTDCDFTNVENLDYAYRIIGIFEDLGSYGIKIIKKDVMDSTFIYEEAITGVPFFTTEYFQKLSANGLENYLYNWNNIYFNGSEKSGTYNNVINKNIYLHEMNKGIKMDSSDNWVNFQNGFTLMNISDYALASGEDYLASVPTKSNNWLHFSNSSITPPSSYEMTASKDNTNYSYVINSDGNLDVQLLTAPISARPVFYLNSDVTISGEGTIENPYIIK